MARNEVTDEDAVQDSLYAHQADTEPVPGYRLIAPLGRGGFGEVWKCEAPGGLLKAVKFVQGSLHALDHNAPAEEELRAIQRIKAIRHPFILSMERVEYVAGELVIVLELADKSLADVLRAEQTAGKQGIGRESLLAYLREAAEALDLMNVHHGLQHLDIKPQNLFLVSNHVKVGDFGLVNSCAVNSPGSSGGTKTSAAKCPGLGAVTPLYASPEVFQGSISRHCDQYSLAIVYQELLTGTLPFNGKNSRQLLMQHMQGQPNLEALPAGDREVIARALSKAPGDRFPTCSEFVQALLAGLTEVTSSTITAPLPPGQQTSLEGLPEKAVRTTVPDVREEMRRTPSVRAVKTRAVAVCRPVRPGGESFPGVEVTDLVSRTPLTEVWNARAGAEPRVVKVLFGCPGPEDEGVGRFRALRHPALAPIDVLHHAPGRVVLSSPPGDRSLRDVLADCQSQGRRGIPRRLLLNYLKTTAETLDFLAKQGVHHLGLNPRTLVLEGDRLRILDFGLAHLLWLPTGQAVASLNGRYSAPELSQRQVGPACDQYSLALIYHELLTGCYPATAPPRKGEPAVPCVDRLPASDRLLVARALHPDPQRRWETAADLIRALQAAGDIEEIPPPPAGALGPPLPAAAPRPAPAAEAVDVLQMRFGTNLTVDVIRQRLEGFRQQWQGTVVTSEARSLVFRMQTPQSFWQRWTGKQPGLEIQLNIGAPEMEAPAGVQTRTEVRMSLHPHNCTRDQSGELLKAVGPLLVESVRTHLRMNARGRMQERTVWHHPLQLCSMLPDGSQGPPVECQGKDISLNGIGFYLPGQVPSSHVMLHLPKTDQTPKMSIPCGIVRVQGCGDGWYEVGAVLLPPHEPPVEETAGQRPATATGTM